MISPYVYPAIAERKKRTLQQKIDYIVNIVLAHFKADLDSIKVKTRKADVMIVRQFVSYFLYKEARISLNHIKRMFDQDHSTIIHSCKRIEDIASNVHDKFYPDFLILNAKIKNI